MRRWPCAQWMLDIDRAGVLAAASGVAASVQLRSYQASIMELINKERRLNSHATLADPGDANVDLIRVLLSYEKRLRDLRLRIFDAKVINDPSWLLLQDLFAAHLGDEKLRTKELCAMSGLPHTTVIRYLDHLEKFDVVIREVDPTDSRATLVFLSQSGIVWMHEFFDQVVKTEAQLAANGDGILSANLRHLGQAGG